MDANVLDKVWVMFNNEPVEVTISKKVITHALVGDNVETNSILYAKYSKTLQEDTIVNSQNAYPSKNALMTAVFKLEE
jgi:hypothetical protein